jgi:hypothetical protein
MGHSFPQVGQPLLFPRRFQAFSLLSQQGSLGQAEEAMASARFSAQMPVSQLGLLVREELFEVLGNGFRH